MNEMIAAGPCADFEHDIVELIDGALDPARAHELGAHLAACPRCRDWQVAFAAFDSRLAESLPQPELSAGFAQRLRERLALLATPAESGELRVAADREYRRMLESLGHGLRRNVLLDALAGVGIVAAAVALIHALLPMADSALGAYPDAQRFTVLGAIGALVAVGALAWSATRGALSAFRLRA
jgi:anti-sigma factor RsiW